MAALRDAIALLPRGAAWSKSPDSRFGWLLDALTREFDRVEARAPDLLRESNPATTSELLLEWDAIVGLDYPDLSTTEPDASLARAMIAWLLGTSTLSRESIERFCALSELQVFADGDGNTFPLFRLLSVEHTDTHEATIRLLADGGSNAIVEALFRRKAHATGTLIFFWPAPFISISTPADESIACDELVTVTGTSLGVGTVELVVTESGGLVTMYTTTADAGDGDWSVQIVLASYLAGEPATIVARGYAGIVTADSGWVESDPVEVMGEFFATVTFSGPFTTTVAAAVLTGTGTPGGTVTVTLRGDDETPVVVDGGGDWTVTLDNQLLNIGENELTISIVGPAPCSHTDSIIVEVELESSGGVAPTITVAPVLAWTVADGSSPAITPPVYTGDPGTITYDLIRLPSTTVLTGVDLATAEAYVAVRATDTGPSWRVTATVTNGSGSDSANSNTVAWDPIARLPTLRLALDADVGVSLVGSDVDAWADQSGVGNDFSAASSGVRPLFVSSGFNGGSRPYVEGDGAAEWLRDAAFSMGATPYGAYTVLEVAQEVAFVSGRFGWSGQSVRPFHQQLVGPTRHNHEARSGAPNVLADSTTPAVRFFWLDSTTTNTRIGSGSVTTVSHAAQSYTDSGPWALYARSDSGGSNTNRRIAAYYICRQVVSTAILDDFRAYAAWRWGV